MPTLYFSPLACSLASRIALYEAGIQANFVAVTLSTKRTQHDDDYRAINPKGQVPALLLDDGILLTEGAAVLQHIADMAPASRLAPPEGTLERRRLQGWLNLVGAEIHSAGFVAFMHPMSNDGAKAFARLRIEAKFDQLQTHLDGRDWLMDDFSVADAYLVTALGWCEFCGIDLNRWPALAAFRERARTRPAVARALSEELALRAAA